MRIEWLNKKGSDRVIVFFHGWGMDAAGVSHLQIEDDVLMCYDYRSLDFALSYTHTHRRSHLQAPALP